MKTLNLHPGPPLVPWEGGTQSGSSSSFCPRLHTQRVPHRGTVNEWVMQSMPCHVESEHRRGKRAPAGRAVHFINPGTSPLRVLSSDMEKIETYRHSPGSWPGAFWEACQGAGLCSTKSPARSWSKRHRARPASRKRYWSRVSQGHRSARDRAAPAKKVRTTDKGVIAWEQGLLTAPQSHTAP